MVAKTKTHSSPTTHYIKNVVDKPQVFFSTDPELVNQSIALTKHLYDTGKPVLLPRSSSDYSFVTDSPLYDLAKQYEDQSFSPFPELLTEGFDHDQIWEELVTQNEPFLHHCKASLKKWAKPSAWISTVDTLDDDESASGLDDMDLSVDEQEQTDPELDEDMAVDGDQELQDMEDDEDEDEDEDEEIDAPLDDDEEDQVPV
jgi:U3 small nucleolar RNA-associated protein MPP10